mmetsp:Transcript_23996/g.78064  ORF Transcript_23996/g.78064 Transcript_23996/m.78064 type:complete len:210 (+) Transcript_23996:2981-3610(+)
MERDWLPPLFRPDLDKMLMNFLNSPFFSGMMEASIASSFSPEPARSATNRSLSKFMFAPLVMATTRDPFLAPSVSHFFAPATARAPEGSVIERVSSKMSLIATQISSVSTSTISSTSSRASLKVKLPTVLTATPSAKVSTLSSTTCFFSLRDRYIASAPVGSTPIILMSGRSRFTYAATPAMRPPPPTGMKMASIGFEHCLRISRPIVP